MVTVYINRWGIKIPALLYCYPSKTKGPEYFFLSFSILLFSIIDKAIMQHSDSHHLVEVNLHRYQLLLNLTLLPSLPKLMLQLPQSSWTLAHEISAAVNIIPLFYSFFWMISFSYFLFHDYVPPTLLLFKCSYSTITSSFPHVFSSFHNSVSTMHLLFTDASSIIKSIKKIHAQHVDLTPDNSHVRRYTGRLFSWGNNLQEKIKQFIRFAGKKPVLPD